MIEPNLAEAIEKYVLGHLGPGEQAWLESRAAADPTLREQIELVRLALVALDDQRAAELREKFGRWEQETSAFPTEAPRRSAQANVWAWATAAMFFLCAAGAFWHFQKMAAASKALQQKIATEAARCDSVWAANSQPKDIAASQPAEPVKENPEALAPAAQHRKPSAARALAMRFAPDARAPSILARKRGLQDSVLRAAFAAFDDGRFSQCAKWLETIPLNDERHSEAARLMPYALFYAESYEQAMPAFIALWASDKYEAEEAQFYLSLCFVGQGQTVAAKNLLATVANKPSHKFAEQARQLLRAL